MIKVNNAVITDHKRNKTIIVSINDFYNNKYLFNGIIGKRMINKLKVNNINFTLIED